MSDDKKRVHDTNGIPQSSRQINEGREVRINGRQIAMDGFETRGGQFQAPIGDPRKPGAGRQTGPINLAPTNFQSPKVPKIPAKKS